MPAIKKEHLIRLAVPGTVAVTGGGKTNGPAMLRAASPPLRKKADETRDRFRGIDADCRSGERAGPGLAQHRRLHEGSVVLRRMIYDISGRHF